MKIKILLLSIISISFSIYSQQTVKGKVVDLESQFPLPGVNVKFINGDFNSGVATDINGNFKIENTLTVNGSVYTAGAVEPQHLFSFESIDETGDMKIVYSQEAIARINESKEMGGTTQLSESTLGSWVLVDAKTGKQFSDESFRSRALDVCNYMILATALNKDLTHTRGKNDSDTEQHRSETSGSSRPRKAQSEPTEWNQLQRTK